MLDINILYSEEHKLTYFNMLATCAGVVCKGTKS